MRGFALALAAFIAALALTPYADAGKPKRPRCTKPSADLVVITCAHGKIKVVRAVIGSQLHVLTFVLQSGVRFFFSDTLAKNLPSGGPAS